MLTLEAPEDRFEVLGVGPDVPRVVVAGDDDELGSDLHDRSFAFRREGVTVSPDFEMVAEWFVDFVEVLDDHGFVVKEAVPPLIAGFEVCFRVVGAGLAGFPGAGIPVVPQVLCLGVLESARFKVFFPMVCEELGV